MAISIVVCGQSNALGHWRNASDTEAFPNSAWRASYLTVNPTSPRATDVGRGHAIWPYVAQLLWNRHRVKAMFWNAAQGGTALQTDWNGQKVVQTFLTTSGTTLSAASGLDVFSNGDTIRLRNCGGNLTNRVVVGNPTATDLTVNSPWDEDGGFVGAAAHGAYIGFSDAAFDPNGHYATAFDSGFSVGRFDAKYVLCQWGNSDQENKQTQADCQANLQTFVDYWQSKNVDKVLLGGTLVGTTVSGDIFSNRMNFMQNAWLPACEQVVADNSNIAHLGAHMGQEVNWDGTNWYKSDGIHWNYGMNYIAAEAWYRVISEMLGYIPSTAGRAYTAIGDGSLVYPVTRVS